MDGDRYIYIYVKYDFTVIVCNNNWQNYVHHTKCDID